MILVSTLQSLQQPKYQLLLRDINQSSKCSNSQIFDTFHWNHRKELLECSVCHKPTEIMVESSDHKYIAHIQHLILSVSKMILFSGFYRIAQVRFMILHFFSISSSLGPLKLPRSIHGQPNIAAFF